MRSPRRALGDGRLERIAHVPGEIDPGVLADLGDEGVDQRPARPAWRTSSRSGTSAPSRGRAARSCRCRRGRRSPAPPAPLPSARSTMSRPTGFSTSMPPCSLVVVIGGDADRLDQPDAELAGDDRRRHEAAAGDADDRLPLALVRKPPGQRPASRWNSSQDTGNALSLRGRSLSHPPRSADHQPNRLASAIASVVRNPRETPRRPRPAGPCPPQCPPAPLSAPSLSSFFSQVERGVEHVGLRCKVAFAIDHQRRTPDQARHGPRACSRSACGGSRRRSSRPSSPCAGASISCMRRHLQRLLEQFIRSRVGGRDPVPSRIAPRRGQHARQELPDPRDELVLPRIADQRRQPGLVRRGRAGRGSRQGSARPAPACPDRPPPAPSSQSSAGGERPPRNRAASRRAAS